MIDALPEYIARFAGYGDLHAPLWFVGMEEGGGRDIAELRTRVNAWASRGHRPLEDLASYHRAIGLSRHFNPPFPLQRTWGPLARTLQSWRGASTDHAALRHVQTTEMGAHGGSAALLELMPLPSPSSDAWPYAALAAPIPALMNREHYRSTYQPARIEMLRALIRTGTPRAIVCYGLSYREAWAQLAGSPLHPITIAERVCYVSKATVPEVIAVPHPVARGGTSHFWEELGTVLRVRMAR